MAKANRKPHSILTEYNHDDVYTATGGEPAFNPETDTNPAYPDAGMHMPDSFSEGNQDVAMMAARGADNGDVIIDWDAEDRYWREAFHNRPYVSEASYDNYQSAYEFGVDLYNRFGEIGFNQLNPLQIRDEWNSYRRNSTLGWDQAEAAARDAYDRLTKPKESESPDYDWKPLYSGS